MKNLLTIFTLFLALLAGGCGYHLRGAYQLPPQMATTMIRSANMNGELVHSLKRSLETSNINVVQAANDAENKDRVAVLRIVRENDSKRVLSVDANGRVREYELQYEIAIELSGADGFFVPEQKLELSRDFLFDPEDVLGKSDEEAELIRDMQQDMARLIMLRLQAVARQGSAVIRSTPAQ
jgi:LPS-assembly lipoprotein